MRGLQAGKMMGALLIVTLLAGWHLSAFAEESPVVFRDAFSKIMENYVEQPDPSYLASSAVNGMEELLNANNRSFAKISIDYSAIGIDAKKAENLVADRYLIWSKSAPSDPRKWEYAAITGMLAALDPHSGFLTPEMYKEMQVDTRGSFGGVGLEINAAKGILTVVSPIEDTPAYLAGIKARDQITRIDGISTQGITVTEAVKKLRGPKDSKVTLAIMRNGFEQPREFTLVRAIISVKSVKFRELQEGIGYLRISSFQENAARDVENALNKLGSRSSKFKGLVLDLRNNPGGLLSVATDVAGKFVGANTIVTIRGRGAGSENKFEGKTIGTQPLYPIIVLVNEGTASGAEIVAGALQDQSRALLLGKHTFGKGNVQTILPLSDGSALRLTTAKYYLPSGKVIQGNGIFPDVESDETEGQDSPLRVAETAINTAKTGGVTKASDKFKYIVMAAQKSMGAPTPTSDASPMLFQAAKQDVDDLPRKSATLKKNAYAIVIGIEKYRQKLPKADFAVSDAKLVSEYLSKVMGYPEENIVTLTNEYATKSDFEKYFEQWLVNHAEKDSSIFIYYSGHGAPNPKNGDAYLVPYDGDPSFIAQTGYPLKKLYVALGKLPAKEIIVALDSCFSGAGGRSVLAKGARPLVMNLQSNMAMPKNITVMSASSGEQISSTYDEKGHGLFTYFMLKGIKNEDVVKKDGSIAISDLFSYLKPQVERIARKQYNNEQTPQLIGAKKN
ncbi:MAG: S41 family peptidase [Deltaproteobacteria bacterium]|nr:S41 family peptidase [Deltaproteobacteria bacterium]